MKASVPFLSLCGAALLALSCAQAPAWNVVLITLDTTRADFIGCYGKESARTPVLDRLAAEGYLFEDAISSNPVTQAAHSTILTGVYPMRHGVRDNLLFRLPEEQHTLAEILKSNGYRTGAAIGGFPLTREFGTDQGFDFYDDALESRDHRGQPAARDAATWYNERPAAEVNDAILGWLRKPSRKPFFFWLHYWDPHEPHIAPPPYNQLFAHDPYQGEIAYADESLGTIVRELETMGELDRTIFVVTADHGEGRREHREMTHAFLAYQTTLHVPLIMRVPEREGGHRISERVGTVDIVPTIVDLLDIEPPEPLQGLSLEPAMRAQPEPIAPRRDHYAESLSPRLTHGYGELRALYRGPFKFIHGPRAELFDLDDDPKELSDLLASEEHDEAVYTSELQAFLNRHASDDAAAAMYEASEETKRKLAALGYIDTSGGGSQAVHEELRADGIAPQDGVGTINGLGGLRRAMSDRRWRHALDIVLGFLEDSPDNTYYQSTAVTAYVGLGDLDAALELALAAEQLNASNIPSFARLAEELADAQRVAEAQQLMTRLVEAEPTAGVLLAQARIARSMDDDEAFLASTRRGLELEPEHLATRHARLELFRERERYDDALVEATQLIERYPFDGGSHLEHAEAAWQAGEAALAAQSLERTLRLAPAACRAHLLGVRMAAEADDEEAATQALSKLNERCRDRSVRRDAAALVAALSADPESPSAP